MKKTFLEKYHLTIGLIGVAFILLFILQNSEIVSINFLFWKFQMSRIILILVLLVVGFLSGYVFHGIRKKLK
ncbi:MAG: lipopolysaccharide assembly protein LapA domain-containing protein [Gammaproteobacteria bacterium]|nr:lipopolysaccharide assembly protein LapA domain-containing protein [Gammaproteobacteria bacterium]